MTHRHYILGYSASFCLDTLANVVERLSFADLYDRQALWHSCLSFITSTPAVLQEVQGTDAFEHLSETRPKLLKDILAMSSGVLKKRKLQVQADAFEFPDGWGVKGNPSRDQGSHLTWGLSIGDCRVHVYIP